MGSDKDFEALSAEELNFVTFCAMYHQLNGTLPSAALANEEFGLPVGTYNSLINKDNVVEALKDQGVVFERFGDDWTAKSLTPEQLVVANTLLDLTDTRTNKKKLQDLGVRTQTYNAWLKDPVFKEYLRKRAEQLIGDNQHEVDLALLDQVRSGHLKAIEYYNEFTGRFVRSSSSNPGVNFDFQGIIVSILEIIDEEVHDADVAAAIGDRLLGLVRAHTIAGALVNGDQSEALQLPTVAKPRANTAEVQELIELGVGYNE